MMDEQDLSLGSRRSTRIGMRTPVRLQIQHQDGSNESVEGYSIVVNKHGARIEAGKPVLNGATVRQIKVLASGAFGSGKVVWINEGLNDKGKYEFGVELDDDKNIWGVFFPPDDWGLKSPRRGAALAELKSSEVPASVSSKRAISSSTPSAAEASFPVANIEKPDADQVIENIARGPQAIGKNACLQSTQQKIQPVNQERLEALKGQAEAQAQERLGAKRDVFLNQLNAMVSEALAGFQKRHEEILPSLQAEFSEQCKVSGNVLLAEHLDHLQQNCSQFMQEAAGKLGELINLTQTVLGSIEELHKCNNQLRIEATNSLQLQMTQTANDYYRKVLAALSGKLGQLEEKSLQKAQNEMEEAIQKNLHRFQKVLGESIVQLGKGFEQEE